MKNKLIYRVLPVCAGILSVTLLILFGCIQNPTISQTMRTLALFKSRIWGNMWGVLPNAASEVALPLFAILMMLAIIYTILREKSWGLWLTTVPFVLFAVFVLLFGVHYTAPPLSEAIGLKAAQYSKQDLSDTLKEIVAEMNKYAYSLERDQDGILVIPEFRGVRNEIGECYGKLSEQYGIFKEICRAPKPKPTAYSGVIMSYVGISGYYFPFTGTPVISSDNVSTQIPYCIAHEWAHAGGIGPEDECNFAAFLACMQSDDKYIQYSGLFNAYVYTANALANMDIELTREIIFQLLAPCKMDIYTLNTHIEKYETPIQEVGNAINDTYIKSTGQPDGVRSYGKMVDLLISYYKQ